MLVLEKQEYDLNLLFSFDYLKQILLKLAKTQNAINEEMRHMKQDILKRDKIIVNLTKEVFKNDNINESEVHNVLGYKNEEEGVKEEKEIKEEKEEKEIKEENKINYDTQLYKNENEKYNQINLDEDDKNNDLNDDKKTIEKTEDIKEFIIKQKDDKDKVIIILLIKLMISIFLKIQIKMISILTKI